MTTTLRALLAGLLLAHPALADAEYPGSPASVTAAYVEADGAGAALDSESLPKLLRYTSWDEAPGWDTAVVIKSYEIGAVGWNGDREKDGSTAVVEITYRVLGRLAGMQFIAEPAEEQVAFDLLRKDGRWQLIKPQLAPHLTVSAAIHALEAAGAKDDATGKASLAQLRALEK
jgi:hypothetical protein